MRGKSMVQLGVIVLAVVCMADNAWAQFRIAPTPVGRIFPGFGLGTVGGGLGGSSFDNGFGVPPIDISLGPTLPLVDTPTIESGSSDSSWSEDRVPVYIPPRNSGDSSGNSGDDEDDSPNSRTGSVGGSGGDDSTTTATLRADEEEDDDDRIHWVWWIVMGLVGFGAIGAIFE